MSEIQRATPEVVRRIEERWAGLLPRVEAKLQTVNGFDRGQEMRLLDQAAQASSVAKRVMWLGLDPPEYGTHSMRRTKATLVHHRTKNLRAVELLLGHSKIESTIRYLGIEVDDALELYEQTEICKRPANPS